MSSSSVTISGGYKTSDNNQQISLGFFDGRYLQVTGANSMTGNLSVGGQKLINVGTPTLSSDGVNKNYADSAVSSSISSVNTIVNSALSNLPFTYLYIIPVGSSTTPVTDRTYTLSSYGKVLGTTKGNVSLSFQP